MKLEQEFIDHLMNAPDTQMDDLCKKVITSWNGEPTALDILFLSDKIVYFSLGSGFVVRMFDSMVDMACKEDNISREDVEKQRCWSNEDLANGTYTKES
jgi:hypothetical protein